MPCSGPRGPLSRRSRSSASAISTASGLVSMTLARTGPFRSMSLIRSRYLAVKTREYKLPDRSCSARSATETSSYSKGRTSGAASAHSETPRATVAAAAPRNRSRRERWGSWATDRLRKVRADAAHCRPESGFVQRRTRVVLRPALVAGRHFLPARQSRTPSTVPQLFGLQFESLILRPDGPRFTRFVRVRLVAQVKAHLQRSLLGDIERVPQSAGRGPTGFLRGEIGIDLPVRLLDQVHRQPLLLGGNAVAQQAVPWANRFRLLARRRFAVLEVLVQAQVGRDQRLAGVLDDVLLVVGLGILPHKRFPVPVGDQVVDRNELVDLLGHEQRFLGLLGRGTGVEEEPEHLQHAEADASVHGRFEPVLTHQLVVGHQTDGQPLVVDPVQHSAQ